MVYFTNTLVGGLQIGAIYALVALGFVLIFKSSQVINIAQGAVCMIGAFICWTFCGIMGLNFVLAFFLTIGVAVLLGWVIERLLIRPLIGQPLLTVIMMTIGLLIFLDGLGLAVWGPRQFSYPDIVTGVTYAGGICFSHQGLFNVAVVAAMFVIFALFYRYLRIGLSMRALADDQQAAQSVGIKVSTVYRMSWIIACVTAAVGGILLAFLLSVTIVLTDIGIMALPAVIVGGMDSILGALIGGLIIGVLQDMSGAYLDPIIIGTKEIAPYVVLLLIIIFKPFGLFGLKRIERI